MRRAYQVAIPGYPRAADSLWISGVLGWPPRCHTQWLSGLRGAPQTAQRARRKGTVEKRSLIEVQVERVKKGGLKARDVLYVRVWRIESIPSREKPMGRYGHKPIPKAGDKVRVFVVRGPYAPANQTDNGYAAVYPNGFEILTKDSR